MLGRDRAVARSITVAQGQCAFAVLRVHTNHIHFLVIHRCGEGLSVQAEVHITGNCNAVVDRNVIGQVVVARRELVRAVIRFGSCRPAVIQRLCLCVIRQRLPHYFAVRAGVRAACAAEGVDMQVAFGEDDAVAVEPLAVAAVAVAGKGVQVGFRQGVLGGILIYALGNGEVAALGNLIRRGHADLGTGTKRTDDRDGLTSGQIDVGHVALCRVAGDVHVAGDGEGAAVHIHAAQLGFIIDDAAAVHIEGIPGIVDAAPIVPLDDTAIHIEGAGVVNAVPSVPLDGAAVHIKFAAAAGNIHAGTCSADTTTIHKESAIGFYFHAVSCTRDDDFSVARFAAIAVAEGEGGILGHIDGVTIAIPRDTVPVQAEVHITAARPRFGTRHILGQVVVARPGDSIQTGNGFPLYIGVLIVGVAARLAANGVLMRQAVVEVDIDVDAGVLHLNAVRLARVGGEIVRCAAVLRTGGNGGKLAGIYHISSHADSGFRLQTFPADGNLYKGRVDVARRIAVDAHVAGDVHVAGDGEGCVGPYATTILGFVAGDAAAGHGKCTGRIHAAAIRFILTAGCIVGNAAAGHGEFGISVHIHAAAVRGGGVAGDLAAVHGEFGPAGHIHAAAAAGHGVAGNAAAVHGERPVAAHIHAALSVAGDAAAVHGEGAIFAHRHTPAGVLLAATIFIPVGDLALAAAAVAEGKVAGSDFNDTGIISVDKGDAVAIQAKGHFVGGAPRFLDFNILRQVVAAAHYNCIQPRFRADRPPICYHVVLVAMRAGLAANGVVVVADQGERFARAVILQLVFVVVPEEVFLIFRTDILGNDLIRGLHAHADAGRSVQHSIDLDGVALAFVFSQIDIATRVARDLRRAGDREGCVGIGTHIHTAAGAAVVGDLAAAHGERAAATVREIMVSIRAADKHAAAFFSVVAADLAAAHKEAALIGDKHAAANAATFRKLVSGDLAAVHIKCAAPDKHAAGAGCVLAAGFPWVVIVDCATVHIEFGGIFSGCSICGRPAHKHAGAFPVTTVRDSAAIAVAVAEGEGDTGLNLDDRAVPVQTNAVPVEAKHRAVGGPPCAADRHILGQVVVARPGDFIQTGNGFPLYIGVLIAGVPARLAANRVVGVAAGGRLCRWCLPRGFGRLLLVRVLLVRVLLVRVLLVRLLLVRLLLIRLLLLRVLLLRLLLVRLLLVRNLLLRLLLVRNLLLRLHLVGTGSRYLRQRRRRQHGKADGNCHQQA